MREAQLEVVRSGPFFSSGFAKVQEVQLLDLKVGLENEFANESCYAAFGFTILHVLDVPLLFQFRFCGYEYLM